MTIGEILRNAREEKDLSLKEVQDNIKIRTRYLEALEDNNFDLIPGEAYVKAFIKGYSNFLDLDYIELLNKYEDLKAEEQKELEALQEEEENKKNVKKRNRKIIFRTIIITMIVLAAVFLIYNVFIAGDYQDSTYIISREQTAVNTESDNGNELNQTNNQDNLRDNNQANNEDNNTNPATNSSINNSSDNTDTGSLANSDNSTLNNSRSGNQDNSGDINNTSNETNQDTDTDINSGNPDDNMNDNQLSNNDNNDSINSSISNQVNENNSNEDSSSIGTGNKLKEIEVMIVEKSWIQISVDGKTVFEDILNAGDSKTYKYSDNISMKIGNAAGVKVRKGNRVMGPWGERGEVIKKTIND